MLTDPFEHLRHIHVRLRSCKCQILNIFKILKCQTDVFCKEPHCIISLAGKAYFLAALCLSIKVRLRAVFSYDRQSFCLFSKYPAVFKISQYKRNQVIIGRSHHCIRLFHRVVIIADLAALLIDVIANHTTSFHYHSSFLFLLYLFIKFEHFFCKYILFFILHHSLVTVCRCHLDHGVDSSETPS